MAKAKSLKRSVADAVLQMADGYAAITSHTEMSWASLTFAGARHRITLTFEGEGAVQAGEKFVNWLPEYEFAFTRHLVVNADVLRAESDAEVQRFDVTCELLVLEDC